MPVPPSLLSRFHTVRLWLALEHDLLELREPTPCLVSDILGSGPDPIMQIRWPVIRGVVVNFDLLGTVSET